MTLLVLNNWALDNPFIIVKLREMDTLDRFSAIFHKGDNFCDFLFAFLSTNPLLKRGLL